MKKGLLCLEQSFHYCFHEVQLRATFTLGLMSKMTNTSHYHTHS